jgi:outer membrane protein assembly factor BamB
MKCNSLVFAAIVGSLWSLATVSRADDWPQWRGPDRDGVWRETGILESFPADGLKVLWRAPVGPGFSSPVVAQGQVYLLHSELTRPHAKERVQCLDASNGKVLWTFAFDVSYPDWAFTPEPGMGPAATPVVCDNRLYTLGDKGDLICFDALKGDVIWKKNLETEYGVEQFCFNASPLIEGNHLIVCIGSYGGGSPSCVLALNRESGHEVWKTPTVMPCSSSPIPETCSERDSRPLATRKSAALV